MKAKPKRSRLALTTGYLCQSGLHSYFYRPQKKFAKVMFLQEFDCPRGGGGSVRGDSWGCVVALGGGMCGCSRGGMHGCSGGHAWLLQGGGMHGIRQDTEIRSMSGQYASYWNAFLFKQIFGGHKSFLWSHLYPVLDFW